MTTEEKQQKLQLKMDAIIQFAKDKQVAMGGTQKITPEGYIENTILFKDMEQYLDEPKITDVEATPK